MTRKFSNDAIDLPDPVIRSEPVIEGFTTVEIKQDYFEGMKPTGWGCFKCMKAVVAEFNKDDIFFLHCACLYAKPYEHGGLK